MARNQIKFHEDNKSNKQEGNNNHNEDNMQATEQNYKYSDQEDINKIIDETKEPLMKISTVFPFDPFPDDLVVTSEVLGIISRDFFGSENIRSLLLTNIADFIVQVDIFFATITIIDKDFHENAITIKYLNKKEAIKLRRVVNGLIVAKQKRLDLTTFSKEEVVKKMEELGAVVTS